MTTELYKKLMADAKQAESAIFKAIEARTQAERRFNELRQALANEAGAMAGYRVGMRVRVKDSFTLRPMANSSAGQVTVYDGEITSFWMDGLNNPELFIHVRPDGKSAPTIVKTNTAWITITSF